MEADWIPQVKRSVEILQSFYLDGFQFSMANLAFLPRRISSGWIQTVNILGNQQDSLELLAVSPGGVDSLFWSDQTHTEITKIDTLYGPDYLWDYFELEERGVETWATLYRTTKHEIKIQGFGSTFGAIGGDMASEIPGIGGGSETPEFLQADLELRFTESGQKASLYRRDTRFAWPATARRRAKANSARTASKLCSPAMI